MSLASWVKFEIQYTKRQGIHSDLVMGGENSKSKRQKARVTNIGDRQSLNPEPLRTTNAHIIGLILEDRLLDSPLEPTYEQYKTHHMYYRPPWYPSNREGGFYGYNVTSYTQNGAFTDSITEQGVVVKLPIPEGTQKKTCKKNRTWSRLL